jgi:hypothetical protein
VGITILKEIEMLTNKDEAIRYGIQNENVVNRFKTKQLNTSTGCILFNSCKWDKRDKYRAFGITRNGRTINVKAHRFAYALAYGFEALPAGYTKGTQESLTINHKCRNVRCVNPEHLEVITNYENGLDGVLNAKG